MDLPDPSLETLLEPPVIPQEHQPQNWFVLPADDPVLRHLATLREEEIPVEGWRVARLSPAAFVYCEQATGWKVMVKFYLPKTGKDALHYAAREFEVTQRAWSILPAGGERSIQPLGLWRGALFLEFVEGLTLEDQIAIRRSQPGALLQALEASGKLLSKLHGNSVTLEDQPDFSQAAGYANKIVDNLVKHGVLGNQPLVQEGIRRFVEKWAEDQAMWDFPMVLNHGDATTTNFIFPAAGGVVAIDWERCNLADPAADLGRLMAEITHSVNQHGGDMAEGQVYAQELGELYGSNLPTAWDAAALLRRAQFYRAISTLRIARNGWVSRQDRLALVLHAFAILSR